MLWILEHVDAVSFPQLSVLLPLLSASRRERVLTVRYDSARVQMILAELLLRHAIREEWGLTVLPMMQTGEKGKPFFPARPDLHFNLSHCKSAVAAALDTAPVGVDIQDLRRAGRGDHLPPAQAYQRILSESERAWVEAGETPDLQERRWIAIWTCKEAWGKARGTGIQYDLQSTSFLPRTEPWYLGKQCFQHLDLGGTLVTLCADRPLPVRYENAFDFVNDSIHSWEEGL